MKPITLKVVPLAAALAFDAPLDVCPPVLNQKPNSFGRKGCRTRLTKKQKAFDAAKHKRQLKRKQQQHARAK